MSRFPIPVQGALSCALVFSFCALLPLASPADHPANEEMNRVAQANSALLELVDARLAQEAFNLEQVSSLRERGFASWLELSRQQVVVDGLKEQRAALAEFQQFTQHALARTNDLEGHSVPAAETVHKLYLPGSIRLVGWIEVAEQQTDSAAVPARLVSHSANPQREWLGQAREKVEKAEQLYKDYSNSDAVPEHWSHQAKLKLRVAEAELTLLQLETENAQQSSTGTPAYEQVFNSVAWNPDAGRTAVSVQTHEELLPAAWRVAHQEAQADSRLRLAELELARHQQNFSAVEELHEGGHASAQELDRARVQVEMAEEALAAERERMELLQQSADALASQLETTEPRLTSGKQLTTHCDWPEEVLADLECLKHLVDLRRRIFELNGQRGTFKVQLAMQDELLKRLEAARQAVNAPGSEGQVATRLRATLAAGEARQIESVSRRIKSLEYQMQDCQEQIEVISLEESRFILQCQALNQARQSRTRLVSTATAAGSHDWTCDYLEFGDLDDRYGLLHATLYWDPGYFRFDFNRRPVSPLIHSNRFPVRLASEANLFYGSRWGYDGLSIPRFYDPHYSSRLDCAIRAYGKSSSYLDRSAFRRYRFGTYSYRHSYPFGILRSDLRRCLPPGYPPWYLPGSPTNLRRW